MLRFGWLINYFTLTNSLVFFFNDSGRKETLLPFFDIFEANSSRFEYNWLFRCLYKLIEIFFVIRLHEIVSLFLEP